MSNRKDHKLAEIVHAEPAARADYADLIYIHDDAPGYRRRRRGRGFSYYDPKGELVTSDELRARFAALAIPPAWIDVWICTAPNGHLQATGRDDQGRKQYIYHPRWEAMRDLTKFDRMILFAETLPKIRAQVEADLRVRKPTFDKVVALVVRLLDDTLIRIGNQEYARQHDSYGLTTLLDDHVTTNGSRLTFEFAGKSGQEQRVELTDRRLARLVGQCQDLPGQRLFQYRNEDGELQPVHSSDVNRYLRSITGDDFTAKDFRTWGGTVAAAVALYELGPCETEKEIQANLRSAVQTAADRLGNTTTVCRQYYIHPNILAAYEAGTLCAVMKEAAATYKPEPNGLDATEAAVHQLLKTASDLVDHNTLANRQG